MDGEGGQEGSSPLSGLWKGSGPGTCNTGEEGRVPLDEVLGVPLPSHTVKEGHFISIKTSPDTPTLLYYVPLGNRTRTVHLTSTVVIMTPYDSGLVPTE